METIKAYITEQKMTVEQLAKLVDIDRATIYRHLKGQKLKLETARKYSETLNIPIEVFLDQVS